MRYSLQNRPAMTLIEVLASLVLLGTLLVGILLAQSRLMRQAHRASLKAQAVDHAESFMAQHWHNPEGLPRNSSGGFTNSPIRWRSSTKPMDEFEALPVEKWVLEIFLPEPTYVENPNSDNTHDIILCRLVLVVPQAEATRPSIDNTLPEQESQSNPTHIQHQFLLQGGPS